MRKTLCLMICILGVLLVPAAHAQPAFRPLDSPASSSPDADPILNFQGTVVHNHINEEIVLEEENRYYVVSIGKEQWNLGIARGNEIIVKGRMDTKGIIGNEVKVSSVDIVSKGNEHAAGLSLRQLGDVLDFFKEGELVLTRGYVSNLTHKQMQITESQRSAWIPFSASDPIVHFTMGDELLLLGVLSTIHGQRLITPVMIKPIARLLARDITATQLKVKAILEEKPVGKKVKTRGRTGLFIGKSRENFLYEGKDMLLIYPSEQYAALPITLGAEVTVVGVFDTEERENSLVGVLREARIYSYSLSK